VNKLKRTYGTSFIDHDDFSSMKETSLDQGLEQIKGNDSLENILDRVFICLRDFSEDYLNEILGEELLKEMSGIIRSKSPDKPIPSIHNYMGGSHESYMDFLKKIKK
jgi:hypothetical protein